MSYHNSSALTLLREFLWKKTNIWRDYKLYGFWPTAKRYFVLREAWWDKEGKVKVGEDKYGNIYWTTDRPAEVGRDRWVEYKTKKVVWEASDVPAEWHMWLHHMRDEPPTVEETEGVGRAVKPFHTSNYTGDNSKRYYPPGHFFNPKHINPVNSQKIKPFDPKNPIIDMEQVANKEK